MAVVDCSPEARLERQERIRELWRAISRPVQSATDRSRSVNYRSTKDILAAIELLQRDEAFCELGGRRASRLSYSPLIKAL